MKKALKILGLLIAMVAAAWLVIFMWPVKARPERAFYRADDPEVLVIAHRGGRGLAPEGTLTAFDHAVSLGADVLEFDTHLTKRSEEHTSELQSRFDLVCRLLLEKK